MGKLVRKYYSEDLCEIAWYESFFSDMAKEGLILKKMRNYLMEFERGAPVDMQYRIEILEGIDLEQLKMYRSKGWSYVDCQRKFYVFCAPSSANIVEIHTDLVKQGQSLKKLSLNYVISIVILMFCISAMIFMDFFLKAKMKNPIFSFVTEGNSSYLYWSILVIFACVLSIKSCIGFYRLKARLLRGIPMNHRTEWKKRRRFMNGFLFMILFAFLFSNGLSINRLIQRKEFNLQEETDQQLPVIRLKNIETDTTLTRKREYGNNGKKLDYANLVEYNWSFLSPKQYKISEQMISSQNEWPDKSGPYTPFITTYYYKFRIPGLSLPVAKELYQDKKDYYFQEETKSERLRDDRFLFLGVITSKDKTGRTFVAAAENTVVVVRYYGLAGNGEIIEEMDSLFKGFS